MIGSFLFAGFLVVQTKYIYLFCLVAPTQIRYVVALSLLLLIFFEHGHNSQSPLCRMQMDIDVFYHTSLYAAEIQIVCIVITKFGESGLSVMKYHPDNFLIDFSILLALLGTGAAFIFASQRLNGHTLLHRIVRAMGLAVITVAVFYASFPLQVLL